MGSSMKRDIPADARQLGFFRRAQVEEFTGRSRSAIYRDMMKGRFPRPVRLGAQSVGWRVADILEWAEDPMGWAAKHTERQVQ